MEKDEKILIGDKEYTREELLIFGMQHYPKFYWIYRGIGLGFLLMGLLFAMIGIPMAIERIPYFWVYFVACAPLFIIALVMILISFKKQPDENYIKHAVDYYTKLNRNIKAREKRIADKKEKQDVSQLLKYKQLLDAGAISQEEYDNKKKEILGE